jgi:hypothetical protein
MKKLDLLETAKQKTRDREDPPLPSDRSIFSPDPETATTAVLLAPSFSGKTSLIVSELNKLTDHELLDLTSILLITDSTCAAPLKTLQQRVRDKLVILDRFIPEIIAMMKTSNSLTENRFRYLVLLDDITSLKTPTLIKMILTLRNSGVSTVISIQYSKLLSPAQRQSIHDYYIMNLRLEDLEYLLSGFISTHMRDMLNEEGDAEAYDYSVKKLAERVRERMSGRKIIHYDQRHDKIKIYQG